MLETGLNYGDLMDCPEDIVTEIVDVLRERAEAYKSPGG